MNKINWKVRFNNPVFLAQLILSILMPVLVYFGLTVDQLTSWSLLFEVLFDAIQNPYVVGTIIVSVWNALNDPTTSGIISDSKQALEYDEPKRDDV